MWGLPQHRFRRKLGEAHGPHVVKPQYYNELVVNPASADVLHFASGSDESEAVALRELKARMEDLRIALKGDQTASGVPDRRRSRC